MKKELGEKIRALRKKIGLSQGTVAEHCGVTTSVVTRWEKGDFSPTVDKLPLLADVLHCTINDLF